MNTTANERPYWLSLDGCRLYFASNRDNAGGTGNEYFVAERTPR